MKFALTHCNVGRYADPTDAIHLARSAEQAGFESIWTVEHIVLPVHYEPLYPETADGRIPFPIQGAMADPLVWASFVAGHTARVKIGTGVLIAPLHNPLALAKAVATLDRLSEGRLLLGVGAGWLREEFEAVGATFDDRGRRLDEMVRAMRLLWTGRPVSYASKSVNFSDVASNPRPYRDTVPLHFGGFSVPAALRAARLGEGFFPGGHDLAKLAALLDRCRSEARAVGRDPAQIEITTRFAREATQLKNSTLDRLEELGVDRVTVPTFLFGEDSIEDELARFSEKWILPRTG